MAVTSTQSLFQYTIASLGQAFSPSLAIQNVSDFVLVYTNATTFVDTTLVLNVDYFVTGTFTNGVLTGPTITLEGAGLHYAIGGTLTIQRAPGLTQPTIKVDGTKYLAATDNNSLDWLEYQIQELRDLISRSLQVPISSPVQNSFLLSTRKNQLAGFDVNGNATTYPLAQSIVGSGSTIQSSSIAALRAISVTSLVTGQQAIVSGYYVVADGGGGLFVYNSTSSATDDGGTNIAPNVGSGRWLRVYSSELHTKWFGCYGDNTHDDSTAFQNAVTAAKNQVLVIDPGAYLIGRTINLPSATLIRGSTMRSSLAGTNSTGANLVATFAGPVLSFNPSVSAFADIEMEHFQITGNGATYGSGDGVFFGSNVTGGGFMHNMTVSAFGRYNINISTVGGFYLKDVYCANATTANFYSKSEFATFDNCQADNSLYSIYIDNGGDGTRIINCTLEGTTTSVIYIVSGAVDVSVEGCNLNLTSGGKGIDCFASRLRAINNKIFANLATASNGIVLESTAFSCMISTNLIQIGGTGGNIAIDDEGSGGNEICGNYISGGVTGLKINPSTYSDVVSCNYIAGATNSVLHVAGIAVYSGNWYDNGVGVYKVPTVSAGLAVGIQNIALGSYSNGAGANTATLTNAPAATNPTKWIPIDDGGTIRYIPAW